MPIVVVVDPSKELRHMAATCLRDSDTMRNQIF